jgi:hypothetical protein
MKGREVERAEPNADFELRRSCADSRNHFAQKARSILEAAAKVAGPIDGGEEFVP